MPTRSRRTASVRNVSPSLVSICIPVFNGADRVSDAVSSALAQDHPDTEVVVFDDGSLDSTVEVLREQFGGSIRLTVSDVNLGPSGAANACIRSSNGALIKFLHHDDRLAHDCVSKMVRSLEEHPSAGMVFSRRQIEVEADTPESRAWLESYGEVHRAFASLAELNVGLRLLRELIAGGVQNWIGEPSCVMVRRACLERVGGFHREIEQTQDLELWLRIMAFYDVAFIDQELAIYRHSPHSLTGSVKRERRDWLDRLWTLDALASYDEVVRAVPELRRLLRSERRMVHRTLLRHALRPRPDDPPVALWAPYVRHRVKRLLGRPDAIGKI